MAEDLPLEIYYDPGVPRDKAFRLDIIEKRDTCITGRIKFSMPPDFTDEDLRTQASELDSKGPIDISACEYDSGSDSDKPMYSLSFTYQSKEEILTIDRLFEKLNDIGAIQNVSAWRKLNMQSVTTGSLSR